MCYFTARATRPYDCRVVPGGGDGRERRQEADVIEPEAVGLAPAAPLTLTPEDAARALLNALPDPCQSGPEAATQVTVTLGSARYVITVSEAGPAPAPVLSPREREIVRMISQGYTNKMVASVLDISLWTVSTHLRRIFAKLGVSTRAAMVARFVGQLDEL